MLRHFYLLSYRVDKTWFSSSGAARDCYVHLHVAPTFQLVFKKFFNVWNAILIYKTLDFFVVNVLPCHVVHDEERKIWTGKIMAAAELESVRARVKDFTSLVLGLFYLISTPLPLWNLFFEGGRGGGWRVAVSALLIYRIFLRPRVWEKYPAFFGRRKEPGTDHSSKGGRGGGEDWVGNFEGRGWEVWNSTKLSEKSPLELQSVEGDLLTD